MTFRERYRDPSLLAIVIFQCRSFQRETISIKLVKEEFAPCLYIKFLALLSFWIILTQPIIVWMWHQHFSFDPTQVFTSITYAILFSHQPLSVNQIFECYSVALFSWSRSVMTMFWILFLFSGRWIMFFGVWRISWWHCLIELVYNVTLRTV